MLRRVPQRLYLIAAAAAGWAVAELCGLHHISDNAGYGYTTSLLLAIGLYGSTFGIDRAEARVHKKTIISAVTVGVLVKAALIGGVLVAITHNPLFIILGVAVAQIDPLSVAALLGDNRMSQRVKTILASWASFDDPVTVLLAVYAAAIATNSFGLGTRAGEQLGLGESVATYGLDLVANLGLAAVAVLAWHTLQARSYLLAVALAALAVVAVWGFFMLGVAIAGLFVRPAVLARAMAGVSQGALFVSSVLLGMLLVNGIDLVNGVLLGLAAFGAQAVVGGVLSRGLNRTDRIHLTLAQQNGITAIILALRLETQYAGAVAAIAPAILVTNLTYFVANALADRAERRPTRDGLAPRPRSRPDPPNGDPPGHDDTSPSDEARTKGA